jgi:large subunit ribosomal protein L13
MMIIDASGAVVGRLATIVAKRLLNGEEIVIVNSERAIITGKKEAIKEEYMKRREIGSSRKGPFFPRTPDRILKRAVRGMLPYQKPRGRKAYKNLKAFIGKPKEFDGKEVESIDRAMKSPADYVTLGDLAKYMGWSR